MIKLLPNSRLRVRNGHLVLNANIPIWEGGPEPGAGLSQTVTIGLSPVPTFHPPSLKNPQKVDLGPDAQTGWKKGDSKEQRKQALIDLLQIHKRLRRQLGKPTVSQTAVFPKYPSSIDWG